MRAEITGMHLHSWFGLFRAGDQPGASHVPDKHATYWATPSALCGAFSVFYSVKEETRLYVW